MKKITITVIPTVLILGGLLISLLGCFLLIANHRGYVYQQALTNSAIEKPKEDDYPIGAHYLRALGFMDPPPDGVSVVENVEIGLARKARLVRSSIVAVILGILCLLSGGLTLAKLTLSDRSYAHTPKKQTNQVGK